MENSTFTGNVGKDRGGAIAAIGQGSVDVQNCTFFGNEAFGATPGRRSGSGGALYASPGMFVAVRKRAASDFFVLNRTTAGP